MLLHDDVALFRPLLAELLLACGLTHSVVLLVILTLECPPPLPPADLSFQRRGWYLGVELGLGVILGEGGERLSRLCLYITKLGEGKMFHCSAHCGAGSEFARHRLSAQRVWGAICFGASSSVREERGQRRGREVAPAALQGSAWELRVLLERIRLRVCFIALRVSRDTLV